MKTCEEFGPGIETFFSVINSMSMDEEGAVRKDSNLHNLFFWIMNDLDAPSVVLPTA